MSKRMLIDASHPEETRVVVLDGNKVEEFDFESASKRPLKGNIYLAKVTRVEPSLQAAFVEYGGNRQGFLAFAEIHPDYYQIPHEDRQALIAEQEAEARRRSEDDIESFEITSEPKPEISDDEEEEIVEAAPSGAEEQPSELSADQAEASDTPDHIEAPAEQGADEHHETELQPAHDEGHEDVFVHNPQGARAEDDHHDHDHDDHSGHETPHADHAEDDDEEDGEDGEFDGTATPESFDEAPLNGEAAAEELTGQPASDSPDQGQALQAARPKQKFLRRKHYKIQEVIKRRQIILVQVVKEERGNKGAALTTYLSLAGRYCVLMPNTPRGGGISRKITNAADRKRLKTAAQSLELPEGMGLIIRTAGESRTKVEIRRDYEYLLRLWDTIRETTLNSNAPACVYEEGDLIKRVIRDLYNNNLSEIVVEGDNGFRNAKDFMRMLMPTHAKNVVQYKDTVPLFQRQGIEAQLDAMFSSTVTLKSGGYIVINQTEALVSIDVNSGRATREHSIEETARKTNLEAADEVGRQLRLRDLAGLIVIDFIDMEDGRNDREVERRIREAVKNDRARVQIGKISQFGLLEMSRQRLRAGVIAGSTVPCPHCGGQGIVRSVESTSLRVMRALEEEAQKFRAAAVLVRVANDVAIYTLNQKRKELSRLESEYGLEISFEPKEGLTAGNFDLERTKARDPNDRPKTAAAVSIEAGFAPQVEEDDVIVEEEELDEEDRAVLQREAAGETRSDEPMNEESPREGGRDGERGGRNGRGGRRRRRGGRNRGERGQDAPPPHDRQNQPVAASEISEAVPETADAGLPNEQNGSAQGGEGAVGSDGRRRRRRRRGRRGGRDRERGETAGQPQLSQDQGAETTAPSNNFAVQDRFGAPPIEIDTTPRDEPRVAPNMSSAPVFSLDGDQTDKKPEAAKKGWWQRTFKSDT